MVHDKKNRQKLHRSFEYGHVLVLILPPISTSKHGVYPTQQERKSATADSFEAIAIYLNLCLEFLKDIGMCLPGELRTLAYARDANGYIFKSLLQSCIVFLFVIGRLLEGIHHCGMLQRTKNLGHAQSQIHRRLRTLLFRFTLIHFCLRLLTLS